jgi:DDE superfamily endonuclease
MATPCLTTDVTGWIKRLTGLLDPRFNWRLLPLMTGLLFATGRRTVSSWLRAAELGKDYEDYYYFVSAVGHKVKCLAAVVLRSAVDVIAPQGRILLAIDDTPTKRYGPKVEGAGIHHNPTPGPAGAAFLYGHVWVTLAWVVRHPRWGAIGLPLLACLYVRQKDIDAQHLTFLRKVIFRTKLVMAGELLAWAASLLKSLGRTLWVVADGAYAKTPLLRAAAAAGLIVVSRLRKDAALWEVPTPVPAGQRRRGRPRLYGKQAISLAKRAGHRGGWQSETLVLYGNEVSKRYKSFLASYRPAGGLIRVVLVKEDDGAWRAYFCTKADASVADILEAVADRSALEQVYHDVKEVHGFGQAQTRNYWSNVAVAHLTLWWHTLIELWAWHRSDAELVDRRLSPWDDTDRRPSHADKRNALRRKCLEEEFRMGAAGGSVPRKIQRLWRRVVKLVA